MTDGRPGDADEPPPQAFDAQSLAPRLRVPPWLAALLTVAIGAGALVGALGSAPYPARLPRAIFFASAFSYLVVSLADFGEHFRLEKAATGRYLAHAVVPIGETLNHAATGLVIL